MCYHCRRFCFTELRRSCWPGQRWCRPSGLELAASFGLLRFMVLSWACWLHQALENWEGQGLNKAARWALQCGTVLLGFLGSSIIFLDCAMVLMYASRQFHFKSLYKYMKCECFISPSVSFWSVTAKISYVSLCPCAPLPVGKKKLGKNLSVFGCIFLVLYIQFVPLRSLG